MIYTTLPLRFHVNELPEVLCQFLMLSFVTTGWLDHPEKKHSWVMGIIFVFIVLLNTASVLAGFGTLLTPK